MLLPILHFVSHPTESAKNIFIFLFFFFIIIFWWALPTFGGGGTAPPPPLRPALISRIKSQSQCWSEKSQLDFFSKSFSLTPKHSLFPCISRCSLFLCQLCYPDVWQRFHKRAHIICCSTVCTVSYSILVFPKHWVGTYFQGSNIASKYHIFICFFFK